MTDYVKSISFAALAGLDALPTTFDTEFGLVAASSATKADKLNPTFSGVVVIPALASATSHAGDVLKTSPAQSSELYMHAFPTGTVMTFFQSTAPTGWTQVTTQNDAMLRVVSTAGGGAGGTQSPVSSLTTTDGHALTINEMPAHTHSYTGPTVLGAGFLGGVQGFPPSASTTGSTGGNAAHSHTITWAPKYIDMILASKD